jgi:alkanesulfonate monooxygenase SsuD/methylene tetrahydromethanopterin reductase-like flavin-dependent oxidoreductase (luciferase family)
MRVSIDAAPERAEAVQFIRQAERLGVDSVWSPDFWAGDACTPPAYLATRTSTIKLGSGIAQLGAR